MSADPRAVVVLGANHPTPFGGYLLSTKAVGALSFLLGAVEILESRPLTNNILGPEVREARAFLSQAIDAAEQEVRRG